MVSVILMDAIWGGENPVIWRQQLIPFLFRLDKKFSKNSELNLFHLKLNLFHLKLILHNSQFAIF